jgi:hypothetical protein
MYMSHALFPGSVHLQLRELVCIITSLRLHAVTDSPLGLRAGLARFPANTLLALLTTLLALLALLDTYMHQFICRHTNVHACIHT